MDAQSARHEHGVATGYALLATAIAVALLITILTLGQEALALFESIPDSVWD